MIYNVNNTLNDNESEEEQSSKVEINKKRVKNVINKKLFLFRVNNHKILGDKNSSNFAKDNEKIQNINRGTLIKKFSNNIDSIIDLSNEENNKNITIKISNLYNNHIFIEYNNNKKLDNNEKILNNFRNLASDIFANTLHFYYPLFKSNLLGSTIGLIAEVEFRPDNGKVYVRMDFDGNGKIYNIFTFEKQTNFNNIITNINEILR